MTLTNFHLIRPTYLFLLPLVIIIWWFWKRSADPLRGWRQQVAPELLEALIVGRESNLSWRRTLVLVSWLIAVIAVSGPTWRLEPSPFVEDAAPLLILLKADISMDQPNPAPSRMELAQLKVADLASERKGQPLGLIAYAGSAHLVLPPTRDTAIVAHMAGEVTPSIMPKLGDRLDLALSEAKRVLSKESRGGSVLVLADTVDTDPAILSSLQNGISFPIQFLSINAVDSSPSDTVRRAARLLNAQLQTIQVDGKDITAIVRQAEREAKSTFVSGNTEDGRHWEEAGYWLLPLIAFCVLLSFRRERTREEAL